MKKILLATFIATFSMRIVAGDSATIIPAPAETHAREGVFRLTRATVIETDDAFKNEAKLLAERLRAATGFPVKIKSISREKHSSRIVLIKTDHSDSATREDYRLSVTPSSAEIWSKGGAGAFYGTQSLLQLFPPEIFSPQRVTGVDWQI